MPRLKLFRIAQEGRDDLYVTARTGNQAAEIFIVGMEGAGHHEPHFMIERRDHLLLPTEGQGLDDLLEQHPPCFAVHDRFLGWGVVEWA